MTVKRLTRLSDITRTHAAPRGKPHCDTLGQILKQYLPPSSVEGYFPGEIESKRPTQETDSKILRKTVTLEEELKVLDCYARGEKISIIVHAMELMVSMLCTIITNKMRTCVFNVYVTCDVLIVFF
ncbi:hypothetical protein E2C01_007719 [Portunus trituberculatus]|uniref:Uncharacterized protein n=1 Tax=Portunus trituberculatus TaxID=210409 RepID=A0A5B7CZZ7_PORTR|nr:hypothetical protein [Portunus trituberculatus]